MGGRLAREAYAVSFIAADSARPFTTNERQVLAYMATIARDTDSPPVFFGGRELLLRGALGRVVPEEPPSDATDDHAVAARRARRSAFETLRQAIAGLVQRGHIERVGKAYPGRTAEYIIRLGDAHPQRARHSMIQQEVGS